MIKLSHYYEHPINLNKKNIKFDLKQLHLLSDFQIIDILKHIEKHGKLLTIYELQTISSITPTDIRKIIPFIKVSDEIDASFNVVRNAQQRQK